ncbi:MAG: hypothetical protein AAFX01_14335 [Cyanobacteria bacterium J06638_28]
MSVLDSGFIALLEYQYRYWDQQHTNCDRSDRNHSCQIASAA